MRYAPLIALCLAGTVEAQDARSVFDKVSPSVVSVKVYDAAGVADGEGSGVVVAPGEVVTNCHVADEARSIGVVVGNSPERKAIVTRRLAQSDLCLLKTEGLTSPPVEIRPSAGIARGEQVFAVGNPLGLGLAVSEGLASAVTTIRGQPRIVTSAAISPGSSGGGLFDAHGRLVGITTEVLEIGQNMNVVVPADHIATLRSDGEMIASLPPEQGKDIDWLSIAEKLDGERQWRELADHAKRWLDAYPTSRRGAQYRGVAQINSGQAAEGRATLIEATTRFPRSAPLFSQLARAHKELGQLDLAEAAARRAIAIWPEYGYGYSVLADVLYSARRYEEAGKAADMAIRVSPALFAAWETRANIATIEKRRADAVSAMRVVARLLPENLTIRRKLADVLAVAGQTGEARTLMSNVGAPQRPDAMIWGNIGHFEVENRRYADAETAFRRSVEIDPEYGYGWGRLGALLRDTNRAAEAEQALRTAVKLDPGDKSALAVLAEIAGKRGATGEAKALLEQAAQGTTGTAHEWRLLGVSREKERDYKGAAEAYARVVELDGKTANDWTNLGNALSILKEDVRALEALQRAEQLDPDNERLFLVFAKFYGERRDAPRALEYTTRAVRKNPASVDAWNSQGYSMLLLGRFKEAIEALNTAVRLDPNHLASVVNLGEAYLRVGEIGRAIAALQHALKLNPKGAGIRLLLGQAFAASRQYEIAQKYIDEVLQEAPGMAAAWVISGMLGLSTNNQGMTVRAYEKLKTLNPQLAVALKKRAESAGSGSLLSLPE